jgi:hypothetical protein
MLGWLKKRKNRAWIVSEFRKRADYIRESDKATQLAVSLAIAGYWKSFIYEYKSPSDFAKLPRDQQMTYRKKWVVLCQKVIEEDEPYSERLISAEMFVYYLTALIENDRKFENEAVEFFDLYACEGSAHNSLLEARRPDCLEIC